MEFTEKLSVVYVKVDGGPVNEYILKNVQKFLVVYFHTNFIIIITFTLVSIVVL